MQILLNSRKNWYKWVTKLYLITLLLSAENILYPESISAMVKCIIPQPAYHRIATFRSAQVPARHHFPPCIAPSHDTGTAQPRVHPIHYLSKISRKQRIALNVSLTLPMQSLFLLRSPCLFISFLCYPKCDRPRCVILARPAAAAPARRRYLRSWSELHSPDTEKKLAPKLTQDRTRAPAAGPAI